MENNEEIPAELLNAPFETIDGENEMLPIEPPISTPMPQQEIINKDKSIVTNNTAITKQENEEGLISDDTLLGVYNEILDTVRSDRKEIDECLKQFVDLVINNGDSSSSSKEALVNLIKLKAEQSDKMTKLADLITRVKLKEKDTFPKYLAASQNNTININTGAKKRDILNALKLAKEEKKDSNE